MSRVTVTTLAVMAAILLLAGLGWRLKTRRAAPPAHAILIDRSASTSSPCDALGGLIEGIVQNGAFTSRSKVLVLVTGDAQTRNEPIVIGALGDLKGNRSMEGKGMAARKRDQAIMRVVRDCQDLPPTRSSPIFLGLRRSLEMLRAQGCAELGGNCTLVVRTDGEETAEPEIRRLLRAPQARVHAVPEPRLDNTGIAVDLCGLGDVVTGSRQANDVRTLRSADRLSRIWHSSFSHGELVRVTPTCLSRSMIPGAPVAARGGPSGSPRTNHSSDSMPGENSREARRDHERSVLVPIEVRPRPF